MKHKFQNNNAFTIIELMVAVGILVVVLSFASVIFKVSINSQRTAMANAEIMQKLRAITDQLNADFRGLDKDGEIFVVWKAEPILDPNYEDNDLDGYERFDCIMFFANGDFQSYPSYENSIDNVLVRGNTARICYSLARRDNLRPEAQKRNERILARTQHILTDDPNLSNLFEPDSFTDAQWQQWNNFYQYDKISLEQWKFMPYRDKADTLSVIADVKISYTGDVDAVNSNFWGTFINTEDPNTIHNLLCEGVGEFKIQGWSESFQRWIPEVDPDGDGDLTDTNFYFNSDAVPGVLYPWPLYGGVSMNHLDDLGYQNGYPYEEIDKEHFNMIPGLGKALKFTFTLYDSKGIIKDGRTFTHIVYLDN